MKLPKRKQIRLKDYDYLQNNAYFVTICTHNRKTLFGAVGGCCVKCIQRINIQMHLTRQRVRCPEGAKKAPVTPF